MIYFSDIFLTGVLQLDFVFNMPSMLVQAHVEHVQHVDFNLTTNIV